MTKDYFNHKQTIDSTLPNCPLCDSEDIRFDAVLLIHECQGCDNAVRNNDFPKHLSSTRLKQSLNENKESESYGESK